MSLQHDFVNSCISVVLGTGSSCFVHAAQITFGAVLRTLASRWNKKRLDFLEVKIEESEKASSRRELNPGYSATELYTTTGLPPTLKVLYIYCTGGTEMPQSHTWQPLSMCRQNPIRG